MSFTRKGLSVINIVWAFLLLCQLSAPAQDNCYFNYQNKKGGHYLFSTYYQPDMKTVMEGICQSGTNDNIYEKRTFKNGHLQEEILNYADAKPRLRFSVMDHPADSVFADMKEYWENGSRKQYSLFYKDQSGRRCEKYTDFYVNGKTRFVNYYAFVRLSEIGPWQLKDYPAHTVDDEGYTWLKVLFGESLVFFENGGIKSTTNHKIIFSSNDEHLSRQGPYKEYWDNGQLKISGAFNEGNPDGKWTYYNYYGKPAEENYYARNMETGTWRGWYDNGELKYEKIYDTASAHIFKPAEQEWNEKGGRILQVVLDKEGNGFKKEWAANGVLVHYKTITANDDAGGLEKYWYESGQLKSSFSKPGTSDTSFVSYYENGQLKELSLKFNRPADTIFNRREWSAGGILLREIRLTSRRNYKYFESYQYYDNGNQQAVVQHKDQERLEEYYFPNGMKRRSLLYQNGLLQGSYQEFDSLGVLLKRIAYKDGLRNGLYNVYNGYGKLLTQQVYKDGCPDKNFKAANKPVHGSLQQLTKEERSLVYSMLYGMLDKYYYSPVQKSIILKNEIDSMANRCLWLMEAFKQHGSFPIAITDFSNQRIEFHLPQVYFKGLEKKDTSNPYVNKLLATLDSLGWQISNWQLQNNEYRALYSDSNFYNASFFDKHFNFYIRNNFLSVVCRLPVNEPATPGNKFSGGNGAAIQLSRMNNCCFKAWVGGINQHLEFIIYDDGEVELYNQAGNWDDVNKMDFSNRLLPYD